MCIINFLLWYNLVLGQPLLREMQGFTPQVYNSEGAEREVADFLVGLHII